MDLTKNKQALSDRILSLIEKEPEHPWRVIVIGNGTPIPTSSGGKRIACLLALGGSRRIDIGNGKSIVKLDPKAEVEYSYSFFDSTSLYEAAMWKVLTQEIENKNFEVVVTGKDDKGNELTNLKTNIEFDGKMCEFIIPPHNMRNSKGELLLYTMGPKKGQVAVSEKMRVFIPSFVTDPIEVYNKAISRITDWIKATTEEASTPDNMVA